MVPKTNQMLALIIWSILNFRFISSFTTINQQCATFMSEKGWYFRVPPIRPFSRSPPLRRMAYEHNLCAFILCVFFSALKDFWNASNASVSVFCTTCDAGSPNKVPMTLGVWSGVINSYRCPRTACPSLSQVLIMGWASCGLHPLH